MAKHRKRATPAADLNHQEAWVELMIVLRELGSVSDDPLRRQERIERARRARELAMRLYEEDQTHLF